jgi:ABC-type multidrug transport system permease subunit
VAFGYGLGSGFYVDGYNYLTFVFPGVIALTVMTSSFNGAGMKLHVDRLFYRCFDECLMSPIGLFSIVIGKTLVGVVRGLISALPLIVVALVLSPLFSINPLFVVVLAVSLFTFSALGVLIALWAKSHSDINTFSSLVVLPMTFLSGTFFSVNQLPEAVKVALYLLPLTHSSLCLRAAALEQPFPWLSFLALSGFGVAFILGCLVMLKRASV